MAEGREGERGERMGRGDREYGEEKWEVEGRDRKVVDRNEE